MNALSLVRDALRVNQDNIPLATRENASNTARLRVLSDVHRMLLQRYAETSSVFLPARHRALAVSIANAVRRGTYRHLQLQELAPGLMGAPDDSGRIYYEGVCVGSLRPNSELSTGGAALRYMVANSIQEDMERNLCMGLMLQYRSATQFIDRHWATYPATTATNVAFLQNQEQTVGIFLCYDKDYVLALRKGADGKIVETQYDTTQDAVEAFEGAGWVQLYFHPGSTRLPRSIQTTMAELRISDYEIAKYTDYEFCYH